MLCNKFTFVALTPGNEIKAEGSSLMRATSSHVSFCTDAVSIHTNCYPSCMSSASVIVSAKFMGFITATAPQKACCKTRRILMVKMIMNTNSLPPTPLPKSKTSPGCCCCFSNLLLQHDDKLPVWTNKSILHTDGQLLKKHRHTKRCCRPSCIKHKTNSNNW